MPGCFRIPSGAQSSCGNRYNAALNKSYVLSLISELMERRDREEAQLAAMHS
jgi:hypothetical protein